MKLKPLLMGLGLLCALPCPAQMRATTEPLPGPLSGQVFPAADLAALHQGVHRLRAPHRPLRSGPEPLPAALVGIDPVAFPKVTLGPTVLSWARGLWEDVTLEIYSRKAGLVHAERVSGAVSRIDLDLLSYAPGTYFVALRTSDGKLPYRFRVEKLAH